MRHRSMEDTAGTPQTLGQKHVSRAKRWTFAVFLQLCLVGFTCALVVVFRSEYSPDFFSSVPWRLALLLSWSAYWLLSPDFFIVSLVAFLVWLARTYGGSDRRDGHESSSNSNESRVGQLC